MATESDPEIGERVIEEFHDWIIEWLENPNWTNTKGVFVSGFVCLWVKFWRFIRELMQIFFSEWAESPHRDLVKDLVYTTAVVVVLAVVFRITAVVLLSQINGHSPVAQVGDGIIIWLLEISHFVPVVILLIYQVAVFSRSLYHRK